MEEYESRKRIVRGRIVKLFIYKEVILFTLNSNGKYYPAAIKNDMYEGFADIKKRLHIGDLVEISGEIVPVSNSEKQKSKNELLATSVMIIKATGLSADETFILPNNQLTGYKSRQYFQSLMNYDQVSCMMLKLKSNMVGSLFSYLLENGYIYCNTPLLMHNFYAGGARPFVTHVNDNQEDVYLRPTSEIALKEIIAGGLERVFEIGSYFRNGSIDSKHMAPYMGAEIYSSYCDESEMIDFSRSIVRVIVESLKSILAEYSVKYNFDSYYDIPIMTFEEYVQHKGYKTFQIDNPDSYSRLNNGCNSSNSMEENSRIMYNWFKNDLIVNQTDPIYISRLPAGNSPLIQKYDNYSLCRTYLVSNGATLMEIAQSETDAKIVKKSIEIQKGNGAKADRIKCDYSPFFHACELGLPPVCSLFVGLERFIPALIKLDNIHKYQQYL